MEVFIVTSGSYSDYQIHAVFSNRKKAKAYIKTGENAPGPYGTNNRDKYAIEEYDVDLPRFRWFTTLVSMDKEGNVDEATVCFEAEESGLVWFVFQEGKPIRMRWSVNTDDRDRAVKVANEKRSQIIALNLWPEAKLEYPGKLCQTIRQLVN